MKRADGRLGHVFLALRKAKHHLSPFLAAAGLILLLTIFYLTWPEIIAALRSNPRQFLVLILLNFLIYWTQSKAFSHLMEPGRKFPKLFFVWGASNLLNYVTAFHAGLLLRGKYFIGYNYTAKEIATKTAALIGINIAVAIVFLFMSTLSGDIWLILIMGFPVLLFYLHHKVKAPDNISRWRRLIDQHLSFKVLLFSFANNCILVISIYSTLPIFGVKVDLIKATQIASSLSLSSIISLMPNNIGIQEGIFVAFSSSEAGIADAISASAFFRAASITAGLMLVIAQGKFLLNLIRGR